MSHVIAIEQVAAALVLSTAQAVELRFRDETPVLTANCAAFVEAVRVQNFRRAIAQQKLAHGDDAFLVVAHQNPPLGRRIQKLRADLEFRPGREQRIRDKSRRVFGVVDQYRAGFFAENCVQNMMDLL